ncbi:MAG: biopolymer transporter ExbD [Hyphomonadaceae bacterium]
MARRKRQRSGSGDTGDGDVNLTPMLDVVFILLIFFIVTAQFIKEPGVDIKRTDVEKDGPVKRLAILIAIDENSEIYIDKSRVEPNEVEFTIKEIRNDNPKGALVVQADNNATAEVLVGLMESIAAAEGVNAPVNISTLQD